MTVPVMRVGEVRMRMGQGFVPVRMTMPGTGRYRGFVIVQVMFVMDVFMIVLHLYVDMLMFMTLRKMQPGTQRHQGSGNEQPIRD